MNITGDLVAFFTLKNRRVNSNNQEEGKDEDLFNEDTEETEEIVTTTEANYNLFEPGNNYFLGVFLSIIVLISVVANLLVLTVMCLRKRKFKSTHIFIVALSVSDTLFSLAIHPMLIATSFGVNPHELFGTSGCNWYGFGAVFFGGLSMCIHGTVAYTRYRIIVHSSDEFWHDTWHNLSLLGSIIVVAFSVAIAPVLGWGRYETFEYGCTLAFHDPSMNMRSYCLIAMFGMMLIPLILCIYCYCRIICYTYQCKLQLFVDHEDEDGDILNIDPMEGFGPEDQRKTDLFIKQVDPNLVEAISLMERKLTRLTLVAALGFMMAWLPFALLCLWEMATPPEEIPTTFRVIACLFCKTATAYNPFIYFFMGQEFRADCRGVLERLWLSLCPYKMSNNSGIYMGESSSGPPTLFPGQKPDDDGTVTKRKVCHPRLDRSSKFRRAMRGCSSTNLSGVEETRKVSLTVNPYKGESSRKTDELMMERRFLQAEKSTSSDEMMETIFATGDDMDYYDQSLKTQ